MLAKNVCSQVMNFLCSAQADDFSKILSTHTNSFFCKKNCFYEEILTVNVLRLIKLLVVLSSLLLSPLGNTQSQSTYSLPASHSNFGHEHMLLIGTNNKTNYMVLSSIFWGKPFFPMILMSFFLLSEVLHLFFVLIGATVIYLGLNLTSILTNIWDKTFCKNLYLQLLIYTFLMLANYKVDIKR